jgi:hypothetical protein
MESNITGHSYCLNSTRASHTGAQAACAVRGGHLAIYDTIFEQQQVEQYFTGMGYMLRGWVAQWNARRACVVEWLLANAAITKHM